MRALLPLSLALMLLAGACGRPVGGLAEPSGGYASPQRVEIETSTERYRPDRIAVKVGTPVEMTVRNTSGVEQNITIRNPQGRVLVSQELPPDSTRTVRFTPYAPGTYAFSCLRGGCAEAVTSGEFIADGSAESG